MKIMSIDFNIVNLTQRIETILQHAKTLAKQAESGNTWQEIFTPLDEIDYLLGKETALQSHLNSVAFSEEFNAEYEQTLPLLSDFYSEMGANVQLYNAFKNLDASTLDEQQQYILRNVLRDFKLSGVSLNDAEKTRYKEISTRLSILSNEFAKNSLQATNNYSRLVSKDELAGLDSNELSKLVFDSNTQQYQLSLQLPAYLAVMTYCENRAVREELYLAYVARASEIDGFDNTQIMNEILQLRSEFANLLGFDTYAQYSLATKMTRNPQEVEEFLNELVDKSKPQAEQELAKLKEFANIDLQPWDVPFYAEKQKQALYGFSKSEIATYFPFERVLEGLLHLIKELYGISAKRIDEKTYHPDVIVLEFDNGGKIYLDSFARENKRSGAWMNDYQGLDLQNNNSPIAFVVCNGSKPTPDTPSLLEFDDVVTLFHEFGHALHHILTEVNYPSVAGINGVPWDGVELPSQYMEFFAYEKATIDVISQHYQTGETLPDALFEKLIASKNYGSGMAMLRQCEFALWDILTHQSQEDTYDILSRVRKKTSLLPITKNNRFLHSFGHIFSGGYAAGYYSYKWAEVLAADAYDIVKHNSTKTADFRTYILATGGSGDFMENYIKFSGKKPNITPLLRASGIGN
jgi:oligopeptidase A